MTSEITTAQLLDEIYFSGGSEYERGRRFERLVRRFLEVDPTYAARFEKVIPWDEWEDRTGHDVGIDLIGVEHDGGVTAIQCKFYDPTSTLHKTDIDSFLAASGKQPFTSRLVAATTDNWGTNAALMLEDQQIPVTKLGVTDLTKSSIDWSKYDALTPEVLELKEGKRLRPHQVKALEDVRAGFAEGDRGQMIMACGTGKTYTALKIVEDMVPMGGQVLFLVPSLALLSQALWDWTSDTQTPMRVFAVCSDAQVSRKKGRAVDADIDAVDLPIPPTTDPEVLAASLTKPAPEKLSVIFATYQSLDVIHRAQELGVTPFNLLVADEAHRTTGASKKGEESTFVLVHDNKYIHADKRLYMTATPRLYTPTAKNAKDLQDITLASMDDETKFGPEFHHLTFGQAVRERLLTDYKVLILTMPEDSMADLYDGRTDLSEAAKIVGVWNAITKRTKELEVFAGDTAPMERVVAFARNIKTSETFADTFSEVVNDYLVNSEDESEQKVATEHIDGTMNMAVRDKKMEWLKNPEDKTTHILSNAQVLSEGVDVPTLDAISFLNPRRSQVDVVQAVGRVMRLAPGKEYGYIILPVAVPAGMTAEEALDESKAFDVVWEVLQALRSHDERFDALINQIELNEKRPESIAVFDASAPTDEDFHPAAGDVGTQLELRLDSLTRAQEKIYAHMVKRVGNTRYWESWAKDVADIAARHRKILTKQLEDPALADDFETFLEALRANLNDGIGADDAIDMLSQHLITKPVFDALLDHTRFTETNPVAMVMDQMLATLDTEALAEQTAELEKFYQSVSDRAAGIDSAQGRQKVLIELYEKFFKEAFSKTAEALGIVYTPVEIVDFILRTTNDLLAKHFGKTLSSGGVNILDPFTGTGTFVVRLLQSGLIEPHDLARKYADEIWAIEIVLLAYYIASANIEIAYNDTTSDEDEWEPFRGIVLGDTFQMTEEDDALDTTFFQDNNARAERLRETPIQVIVGNPPYSVGQRRANDDNPNLDYLTLDQRISDTYVGTSTSGAQNYRSLYDSYIRAIRWASDRIGDQGVVGYVTNAGFLDSNAADGLRRSLADEFSAVYVYNMRGDARTSGEARRKERGNVFGEGTRTPVAAFFLVKDPTHSGEGRLVYHEVDDYLTREQKLEAINDAVLDNVPWELIEPNRHADWVDQRSDEFETWQHIGDQEGVFAAYSRGVETGRDTWVYNFDRQRLSDLHDTFAATYADDAEALAAKLEADPELKLTARTVAKHLTADETSVKWTRDLRSKLLSGFKLAPQATDMRVALHRPFTKQALNSTDGMVYLPAIIRRFFPETNSENFGFVLTGTSSKFEFGLIASGGIPDLHLLDTGQFFPRYSYREVEEGELNLTGDGGGFERVDNITDETLTVYRAHYGADVSKDDIFYYIYGLLHSPEYRNRFANDLKKTLPRIPKVATAQDFLGFSDAGRALADLHTNYETVDPHPLVIEGEQVPVGADPYEHFRVDKMANIGGNRSLGFTGIKYNDHITIADIPESAHDYMLGSRSALGWLLDRYRVTTHRQSKIVNDPNDWSKEVGDPRYILDLVGRIVTVSLETNRIVKGLPPLVVADET